MKYWALVIAGLYGLILIALTCPVALLAFIPEISLSNAAEVYLFWPYWCWVAVMLICQLALLLVPVRTTRTRPISRQTIFWPIFASGLMMGGLIFGLIFSVDEFVEQAVAPSNWVAWSALAVALLLWLTWTLIFFRLSRGKKPTDVISQQCRYLLKGSILELLIAVPTHLVARYRDYCCAGYMTFIGIALGISVMLLSFGPGIFFLYLDRWKRVRPQKSTPDKPSN
ncbi:MAG: hypothetical protein AAB019_10010 [Planctomycetota bacterium]